MMAAAPVQDEDGHVVSHLVVYNDISVAKRQEARLQALIDSSPLALVEFDLETRVRLWNPAAERIFGWTREEIVGRGGLPMAPASRRAESEALFTRVRAGESLNDFETVRQRKDGTLVAVSIAAAPIRDGSGQVVGNMVAYTDIGERKAQEAEVHRLNAELHARLDELAASRSRIVAAGDVERRRLERNLHDGAQQRLVALSLACGWRGSSSTPTRTRPAPRSRRPATSSRSRSTSCGSSRAASTRRCSATTACAPPSTRSRPGATPGRDRRTSPTGGCRSPSRRPRTT